MNKHFDEHVAAALSHLKEAKNEISASTDSIHCVSEGLIQSAILGVQACADLMTVPLPGDSNVNDSGSGSATDRIENDDGDSP